MFLKKRIGDTKEKWNPNVKRMNYSSVTRIPLCILIDISASMEDVIDVVNKQFKNLMVRIKNTEGCDRSIDLLVIFFNGESNVAVDFEALEKIDIESLMVKEVWGYTDTGKALLEAIQKLAMKKEVYKKELTPYKQPKLFLLTDGYPSAYVDAPTEVEQRIKENYAQAAQEIKQLVATYKLSFAAAGIQRKNGACANMNSLKELTDLVVPITEDDNVGVMNSIEDFFNVIDSTVIQDTPLEQAMHDAMNL